MKCSLQTPMAATATACPLVVTTVHVRRGKIDAFSTTLVSKISVSVPWHTQLIMYYKCNLKKRRIKIVQKRGDKVRQK